jgi:hypothetical protein
MWDVVADDVKKRTSFSLDGVEVDVIGVAGHKDELRFPLLERCCSSQYWLMR